MLIIIIWNIGMVHVTFPYVCVFKTHLASAYGTISSFRQSTIHPSIHPYRQLLPVKRNYEQTEMFVFTYPKN